MAKWKRHSLDFKRRAVEQMRKCADVKALARKLKIVRSALYTWKYRWEGHPGKGRADLSQAPELAAERKLREENRLLKEASGQRVMEAYSSPLSCAESRDNARRAPLLAR